jgi:CHASE2 domain-containing sensor protein
MTSASSHPKPRGIFGLSRRELLKELGWVLLIVIVTALLQGVGLLHPIERLIIDVFAATEPNGDAAHTAIINIDDESFAGPGFLGQRPLRRNALARLIIGAASGRARVILMDVDTDVAAVRIEVEKEMTALPKEVREKMNDPAAIPIVWAAATRPCEKTGCVIARDPLASVSKPPPGWAAGLTTLIHDGDDVLRRYKQEFEIAAERPGGGCECSGELKPTLSRAAAADYDPTLPAIKEHDGKPEVLLLNWRADRWYTKRFAASEVLRGFDKRWWPDAAKPMEGKIVLIGGTFRDGRDDRRTPAGEMTGVEVLAHIIESELAGAGMAPFHETYSVLIDVVFALVLTAVNLAFRSATRGRLAVNALMVFVLPLAASWAMYRFSVYWASLAPVTAGVLLHQWHERAKHLELRREAVH